MYWNVGINDLYIKIKSININMRCIEMYIATGEENFYCGLTLTWDVLKYTIFSVI